MARIPLSMSWAFNSVQKRMLSEVTSHFSRMTSRLNLVSAKQLIRSTKVTHPQSRDSSFQSQSVSLHLTHSWMISSQIHGRKVQAKEAKDALEMHSISQSACLK